MTDQQDIEYFARRAAASRAAAERSTHPVAKSIHAIMADRYEELLADRKERAVLKQDRLVSPE